MHVSIYAKDGLKDNSRGKAMHLFGLANCSFQMLEEGEPTLVIASEEEDLIGDTDSRNPKLIERTVTVNFDHADLNGLLDCVAKNGAAYVDEAIALRLCLALLKNVSKARRRKSV